MFNYFTFTRNQKDQESKINEHKAKLKHEEMHREKNITLKLNYEKRIKNFVFEMANSPIKIKDYINPIESIRKEMFEKQKPSKIFHIPAKNMYKNYSVNQNSSEKLKNQKSQKLNFEDETDFVQPKMRFKARTDLERVCDAVNEYCLGKADKRIVYNQLKDLDLNIPKRKSKFKVIERKENSIKKPKNEDEEGFYFEVEESDSEEMANDFKIPKGNKKRFNSQAKELMSEYHKKTHFKGASSFIFTKINSEEKTRNKLIYSKSSSNFNLSKNFSTNNLFENPYLSLKKEALDQSEYDQNKLDYLKSISNFPCLPNLIEEYKETKKECEKYKVDRNSFKLKDKCSLKQGKDLIQIGKEQFNKITQLDEIAKKILKICNFTKEKKSKNLVKSNNIYKIIN